MNESPHADPSVEDLKRQLAGLNLLFIAALAALFLSGIGVNLFLFRQVSMIGKELNSASTLVLDYQAHKEPLLTNLIAGLQAYAGEHPDFYPIIERYGLKPAAPAASP